MPVNLMSKLFRDSNTNQLKVNKDGERERDREIQTQRQKIYFSKGHCLYSFLHSMKSHVIVRRCQKINPLFLLLNVEQNFPILNIRISSN